MKKGLILKGYKRKENYYLCFLLLCELKEEGDSNESLGFEKV